MTILVPQTDRQLTKLSVWWERLLTIPWWGQCLGLWLAALVVLTVVGLGATRTLDLREGYLPGLEIPPDSIPGIWARWDSGYYLSLAARGYAAQPDHRGFFPLYPGLIAGLARIPGLNLAMAGMLIAQLSYLVAILYLYKLARLIQDNHAYAMRSVLYMVLFPASFFFLAIYAEPLYLALSIAATYLALRARPRYILAGLALGLASLARPVGWLLNSVLLIEFIRRRRFTRSSMVALGVGLALSISGIVLFVLYLYWVTGSFLAIPEAQAKWGRHWQYPWITYGKSLYIAITGNRVPGDWFLYAINWVDLFFTTLALVLTGVAIWRSFHNRFSWSLSFYLSFSLIFLLCSEGPLFNGTEGLDVIPLWGMTRWVAVLFPLYLIMGDLSRHKVVKWGIVLVSGALLILATAWWTSGRWVA